MDHFKHTMPAGRFKAECLREIDLVKETGEPLIVTKRGKPIVKIIPIQDESSEPRFGCLKETMEVIGDIMSPIDEEWDAEKGE